MTKPLSRIRSRTSARLLGRGARVSEDCAIAIRAPHLARLLLAARLLVDVFRPLAVVPEDRVFERDPEEREPALERAEDVRPEGFADDRFPLARRVPAEPAGAEGFEEDAREAGCLACSPF